jgi:hypothetical protein
VDFKTRILAIVVVVTNVFGNVSLSWGMKHQGIALGFSFLAYMRLIFSPWILLGSALLLFWLVSRMTLLGWADLSYVLPATSVSYVLTGLAGWYFGYREDLLAALDGYPDDYDWRYCRGVTQPNTTSEKHL